jgi:hypothetical protein
VSVPAPEVGDRGLGEAQAGGRAEPVRRRALGVVEVELLLDACEERPQAGDEVLAGIDVALSLLCRQRVSRRVDHPVISR